MKGTSHMQVKSLRFTPLLSMLIFPVMGMLYALLNKPHTHIHSLVTLLDLHTPFISAFIVPYSLWIFYIYACLIYFFIKDPQLYWETLITYTLCVLSCYAIYSIFQTTVPRPIITGNDIFSRLMRFSYNKDNPFNCFPSIHSFTSYLVMRSLYKSSFKNRLNRTLIYGTSTLIIVSTLFVKQHVILDVIGAIVIVELVYWFVLRTSLVNRPIYNKLHARLERKIV
ncbi:MAG: phosphatase PAP2 family protein [Gorillibacterium sp.]|nr:phosphatase PAP2 family protein [Gorillibacterium sp.]